MPAGQARHAGGMADGCLAAVEGDELDALLVLEQRLPKLATLALLELPLLVVYLLQGAHLLV